MVSSKTAMAAPLPMFQYVKTCKYADRVNTSVVPAGPPSPGAVLADL